MFLLFLLLSTAVGVPPTSVLQELNNSVVKIQDSKSDLILGTGSLVKLKDQAFVVTAQHVAEINTAKKACFENNECIVLDQHLGFPADLEWDVALYPLDTKLEINPLEIDTRVLNQFEELFYIGYPEQKLFVGSGVFTQYFDICYYTTMPAYMGGSGSPVFDSDNKVVGILVAVPIRKSFSFGTGLSPSASFVMPIGYVLPLINVDKE